ncbi:uncharacterized protein PRCAT00003380001 [Priceomyces carsonii]|uniref:uncharacterized protein n=1 Tax=Priceomyces carsonii TaxID=28549 RepID=UPI002ED9AE52|nr:unnamed protein product [Priceomyces carsonii]
MSLLGRQPAGILKISLKNKTKYSYLKGKSRLSPIYSRPSTTMTTDKYCQLADNSIIERPILDDRKYRFLNLKSNHLHALVIQDPLTDKSAASLDVNVGSFTDREYGISGLAHFCEHLLFMGTEKYPEENEYSSYLSKHSGYSNAYTASEHTNYYFELSSDNLEGALDRFSQFFISPLFSKSCKDREIRAVDSENKKNLQSDLWRLYQLDKLTSNPAHPYNGFSTGNIKTLGEEPLEKNLNVRDILIKFHSEHYSSNLMSLVVLGKEDLDTLSSWVADMFSDVPNKNLARPNYNGVEILTPDQLGVLIKAKPIKEQHSLQVTFPIPDDQEESWSTKPSRYYSHLLGHESAGSIFHYLKSKSWATELSAGGARQSQGNSAFSIEVSLTPSGLENWEEIVVNIFQYLKLILNVGPQEWIWKELHNTSEIDFKFRQKQEASSTVSKLSGSLYKFTENSFIPAKYLLSSSIVREFDSQKIQQYGEYLNPKNIKLTLVSQNLEGLDKKEKWYGTEYSINSLPNSLSQALQTITLNNQFNLPKKNEFIPNDFTISKMKLKLPLTHPYLITNNNKFHIWYKQDDRFEVPKAIIDLMLHLPNSSTTCEASVCTILLSEFLEDELNDISYYASMVGLRLSIDFRRDGLLIKVDGYNDKIAVLLENALTQVLNFSPKEERFEAIKFKLTQDLRNFNYANPFMQMLTHFLTLVNDKTYSHEARLSVLDKLIFSLFQNFVTKSIWESGIFVDGLIQGNFDILKAESIRDVIESKISHIKAIDSDYSSVRNVVRLQSYVLPSNRSFRYQMLLKDPENINSCIEYYIQISEDLNDVKVRVLTDLLSTIIHEPCFNQLRTKEQLGYVVFSGTRLTRTTLGFRILVQSERTTDYLEYRIADFLKGFGIFVNQKLTSDQFNKFKQSLKTKKLAKLKNLNEEASRFWESITSGYYNFEERCKHAEYLDHITRADFVAFFNNYISDESDISSRLVMHLSSQSPPNQPDLKLIQASIYNFIYHYDLQIDSSKVDGIIEDNLSNLEALTDRLVQYLKELNQSNPIVENGHISSLFLIIKEELKRPVPTGYPSGNLIDSIEEFRSEFKKSGPPVPVEDLSKFSYLDSEAHL